MWRDPIVEEVRAHRKAIAQEHGNNLKAIIDQVGNADWLLMGSDYPHAEGVEEPRIFAEEACQDLSAENTRKIMYENGMRFMGLTP